MKQHIDETAYQDVLGVNFILRAFFSPISKMLMKSVLGYVPMAKGKFKGLSMSRYIVYKKVVHYYFIN